MLYYTVFFLSVATQCFSVIVGNQTSEIANIILSICYLVLILSAWICAYKAQERYDNYEDEIDDLKKEIQNLKKNMEEK